LNNPNYLYTRTDVGGAYIYDKTEPYWKQILRPLTPAQAGSTTSSKNGYSVDCIAVDHQDPTGQTVYVGGGTGTNSVIMVTRDGGESIQTIKNTKLASIRFDGNLHPDRHPGERIFVDPFNPLYIYVVSHASTFHIIQYTNNSYSSYSVTAVTTLPAADAAMGYTYVMCGEAAAAFQPPRRSSPCSKLYIGVFEGASGGVYVYSSSQGTSTLVAGTDSSPVRATVGRDGMIYFTGRSVVHKFNPTGSTLTAISTGITLPTTASDWAFGMLTVYNQYISGGKYTKLCLTSHSTQVKNPYYISLDQGTTWTTFSGSKTKYNSGVAWASGSNFVAASVSALIYDPFDDSTAYMTDYVAVWMNFNMDSTLAQHIWSNRELGHEELVITGVNPYPAGAVAFGSADMGNFYIKANNFSRLTAIFPTTSDKPSGGRQGKMSDYAGLATNVMVRSHSDVKDVTGSANNPDPSITAADGGAQRSADGFKTFTTCKTNNSNPYIGGNIAISADGTAIVWAPMNYEVPIYSVDNCQTFYTVVGLSTVVIANPGAVWGAQVNLISDKVDANYFYALDSNVVKVSSDRGQHFAAGATLTNPSDQIVVNPWKAGEIWIPCSAGLYLSTNYGSTFSKVSSTTGAVYVGIGPGKSGSPAIAVYIQGTVSGATGVGIFRSLDRGVSWERLDFAPYVPQYVSSSLVADYSVFGRIYLSSSGTGIWIGEPSTQKPGNNGPTGSSSTAAAKSSSSSTAKSSSSPVKSSSSSSSPRGSSSSPKSSSSSSSSRKSSSSSISSSGSSAGSKISTSSRSSSSTGSKTSTTSSSSSSSSTSQDAVSSSSSSSSSILTTASSSSTATNATTPDALTSNSSASPATFAVGGTLFIVVIIVAASSVAALVSFFLYRARRQRNAFPKNLSTI
jgi:xyloglucan-specific exo-beta-1,4-glucanase